MRTFRNESPVQNGHLVQRRYDFYGDDTVSITYTNRYLLEFDGTNDIVTVPAIEPTDITAEIYMVPFGWLELDSGGSSHHFYPFTDGFAITTNSTEWVCWINTSGGRQTLTGAAHNNAINIPHHVVLTYNQTSGAARQYNDGALSSSLDLAPATAIVWGGGVLHISSTDFESYGRFAIVRLWSRTLSGDEVQNLYLQRHARTVTGLDTDLELSLVMSNGSGTTVTDASGNGNNGTVSGAIWTGRDSGALF